MKQQTAVEWLVKQLFSTYEKLINEDIIEQAKQMEKEQIEDAFQLGKWNGYESAKDISEMKDSAEYYNETYNK